MPEIKGAGPKPNTLPKGPSGTRHERPPTRDEWAVLTHRVNKRGNVIMHCYGGYDTCAKAVGAMKKMKRDTEDFYTKAEAESVTYKVRPVFRAKVGE